MKTLFACIMVVLISLEGCNTKNEGTKSLSSKESKSVMVQSTASLFNVTPGVKKEEAMRHEMNKLSAQTKKEIIKSLSLEKIFSGRIIFSENKGQLERFYDVTGNKQIKFYSQVGKNTCYFYDYGVAYGFVKRYLDVIYNGKKGNSRRETMSFEVEFLNCNEDSKPEGQKPQDGKVSFLKGKDPNLFIKDISNYNELLYSDLYHGIDLKYYLKGNSLKYDYILHPGASVKDIRMQYKEVKKLEINSSGELEIYTEWGVLEEPKPFSYQLINGSKKEVKVAYTMVSERVVGFKVKDNYDKSLPLIIDPVVPTFMTFVNGDNSGDDSYVNDIALDAAANVYMTGTASTTMPGTALSGSIRSQEDVYVYKLSADGTSLLYGAILGATGSATQDVGMGIAVNSSGEAFITGFTGGSDYPITAGASQTAFGGGLDAVYTKLNASGNSILYSTFLGGTSDDRGFDIEINSSDEAFIVGTTYSSGLATAGVFQTNYSGSSDGFVAKYSSTGAKSWFTYYGGTNDDIPKGIAINSSNHSFISGTTVSTSGIASTGAYSTAYNGGGTDGFIARIDGSGQRVYGSYIGGVGSEWIGTIRVNSSDQAILIGASDAGNYPVLNAYQSTLKGGPDAVMTAIASDGASLVFSTYIGGSNADNWGKGTTTTQDQYWRTGGLDISDNVAMAVFVTSSSDYTLLNPITVSSIANINKTEASYDGSYRGGADGTNWDSYIVAFDYRPAKTGSNISLLHGSYLGEADARDYATGGIRIVPSKDTCYVVSINSHCKGFPTTTGVYQPNGLLPITGTTATNDQSTVSRFCIPPIPLPVQLIFFSALMIGENKALLEWETAQEKNSSLFIVEKSIDGKEFLPIGEVNAGGASSAPLTYEFYDPSLNQDAYYRLKQIDIDGSFSFSKVAFVSTGSKTFKIYPNPTKRNVTIRSQFESNTGTMEVFIYDQEGQALFSKSFASNGKIFEEEISIESFPSGIYVLKVFSGNEIWVEKIVKE